MKKLFYLLLFCVLSSPIYSQTSKTDKIRQLIFLTGAPKLGAEAIKNTIEVYRKTYSSIEAQFWHDLYKEIQLDELIELVVPVFDQYYSEEQIDQLIDSYRQPSGSKRNAIAPPVNQEIIKLGMEWSQKMKEKVLEKLRERGF